MTSVTITGPEASFVLDLDKRVLSDSNMRRVKLGPKYVDALICLVRHRGQVVSRKDFSTAYGCSDQSSNVVDQAIGKIRRALWPELITTVRSEGFRLERDKVSEGPDEIKLRIKRALRELVEKLHRTRIDALESDNEISLHAFGITWALLAGELYSSGQELLDFTVSSDALNRFEEYEFGTYYERQHKLRNETFHHSRS